MNTSIFNLFRQSLNARMLRTCVVMLTTITLLSGCIFETPKGDKFYRTLWTSDEFPYGQITLEFLCDNYVSIKGDEAIGSYGHYDIASETAVFHSLELMYDRGETIEIIIDEAHRSGDIMQISWHISSSDKLYASTMRRLSSYK